MAVLARKWAALLFAAVAVGLLPWAFWLSIALPSRHVSEHWGVAWGGFDLMLATSLGVTALAAIKRPSLLEASAMTSGTLLLVDAWFDVLTARPGRELAMAVFLAVLCELPLAVLCFWIAHDSERFYAAARRVRPGARGDLGDSARP